MPSRIEPAALAGEDERHIDLLVNGRVSQLRAEEHDALVEQGMTAHVHRVHRLQQVRVLRAVPLADRGTLIRLEATVMLMETARSRARGTGDNLSMIVVHFGAL